MTGPEVDFVNPDVKLIAEAVSEQVRYQIAVAGGFILILIGLLGYFAKEAWADMKSDVKAIMVNHKNIETKHSALHTQVQLIGQQVSNNKDLERIMTTLAAMGSREPFNEDEQ
jgi:hypothetical protein